MKDALAEAIRLAKDQRYKAALIRLDNLLEAEPDHSQARGCRAWVLVCTGRYEEALEDYRKHLSAYPDDTEARYRYAETLRKTGALDEAIEASREVLARDPFHIGALDVWRGCACDQAALSDRPRQDALAIPPTLTHCLNPVIALLEKDPGNFPNSVPPAVGRLLYSLVRCLRPQLVVETGCFVGYSTLSIAQALEENGEGHVHSFDLFLPLDDDYRSPVLENATDALQVARAHAERAGLTHRVTFHKGDSSTSIQEFFSRESSPVDLAFIDGDHLIKGCLKDWEAILALLRPGGVALLHDTNPEVCKWAGPNGLLEACRQRPQEFQAIDLPTPEGVGLGLIQKIGPEEPGRWNPPLGLLVKEYIQMRIWNRKRESERGS